VIIRSGELFTKFQWVFWSGLLAGMSIDFTQYQTGSSGALSFAGALSLAGALAPVGGICRQAKRQTNGG